MKDNTRPRRDPLLLLLSLLVVLSLVVAAGMLARLYSRSATTAIPPTLELTPDATEEPGEIPDPAGPQTGVPPEELRELALALAAIVTALTGLLGLVATQIWRVRADNRADQKHVLALERERLELERQRLALEKERLELERQREELRRAG